MNSSKSGRLEGTGGKAGTYVYKGRTHGISEGCLLIVPTCKSGERSNLNGWVQFKKQLSGVSNLQMVIIRDYLNPDLMPDFNTSPVHSSYVRCPHKSLNIK